MIYSADELIIIASNYEIIACGNMKKTGIVVSDDLLMKYGAPPTDIYNRIYSKFIYCIYKHPHKPADVQKALHDLGPEYIKKLMLRANNPSKEGIDNSWGEGSENALKLYMTNNGFNPDNGEDQLKAVAKLMHCTGKIEEKKDSPQDRFNPWEVSAMIQRASQTLLMCAEDQKAGKITPETADSYINRLQDINDYILPYSNQINQIIKNNYVGQNKGSIDQYRAAIDELMRNATDWFKSLNDLKKQPKQAPQQLGQQTSPQQQEQSLPPPQFDPNEQPPIGPPEDDWYEVGGLFYSPAGAWVWFRNQWRRNPYRMVPSGGRRGGKTSQPVAAKQYAPTGTRYLANPTVQPTTQQRTSYIPARPSVGPRSVGRGGFGGGRGGGGHR